MWLKRCVFLARYMSTKQLLIPRSRLHGTGIFVTCSPRLKKNETGEIYRTGMGNRGARDTIEQSRNNCRYAQDAVLPYRVRCPVRVRLFLMTPRRTFFWGLRTRKNVRASVFIAYDPTFPPKYTKKKCILCEKKFCTRPST